MRVKSAWRGGSTRTSSGRASAFFRHAFGSVLPVVALLAAAIGVVSVTSFSTASAAGYPTIDGQFSGTGTVGPGQTVSLQVAGRGGVPASGVGAVVLNVTVTETTAPSFLTVFPSDAFLPRASNLNFSAGQTVPNMVISKVGDDGRVLLYNLSGTVDLVVDVLGWLPIGSAYSGITPARVLDTRTGEPTADGQFSGTGALAPASESTLPIGGRAGVPAAAQSVVLNVTVANPTASSFLSMWPTGAPRPTAANLNYVAGQTVSNMVIVRLGDLASVSMFNLTGSVDVVVDVLGWFPGSGTFTGVVPARLMDTRAGLPTIDQQYEGGGALGPQGVVTLDVTGRGGVPSSGAGAVALNVTVTEPTADSFLTVWPTGADRPTASNLNFRAGQTVPNMVVVPVGAGGQISLYNLAGSAHVVVDVLGWFPLGGTYSGLVPARLMDTRIAPEPPVVPPTTTVPPDTTDPSLDPFVCRTYTQRAVGSAPLPAFNEISGMARGRTDRSVLWVHEDSGAMADVHALSLTGQLRDTFRLTGATNRDWEDMDVGPGPVAGVNYLYMGDIGGNFAAGNDITVWRVPEPQVTDTGGITNLAGAVGIVGRYPGGLHPNAESMAVGADGTIYVITKSLPTQVFKIPFPQTSGINDMIEVSAGTLGPEQDVSGADIRPDGRALIVRGYRNAWTWPIIPGESMATTLARTPCSTPTFHDEPQGEAVGFMGNDGSYMSTGEVDPIIRQYTLG